MPVYRESGGSTIYDVVKVQTCSGQPLEVTSSTSQPVVITTAGTPEEFTLLAQTKTAGDDFWGAIDFEEISR
jgi:hypothetical protein